MVLDAITIAAAGGYVAAQVINKDLINKIFGPSAEYVGQNLKNYVAEIGQKNVENILHRVPPKLGKTADTKGGIPAKIVKDLILNGAFCENEIEAEYRAGVLASSRSEEGKNDSGSYFLSLINSISSSEMKLHYLAYQAIVKNLSGSSIGANLNLNLFDHCNRISVYLKADSLLKHFPFSGESLTQNCLVLQRVGLFQEYYTGDKDFLLKKFPNIADISGSGLVCRPTTAGFRLFLYAYGKGSFPTDILQNSDHQFLPFIEGEEINDAAVSYL